MASRDSVEVATSTMSSAYRRKGMRNEGQEEVLERRANCRRPQREYAMRMPWSGPSWRWREVATTSMKTLKSRGDMGQPWRTPVERWKVSEVVVPMRTAAEELA